MSTPRIRTFALLAMALLVAAGVEGRVVVTAPRRIAARAAAARLASLLGEQVGDTVEVPAKGKRHTSRGLTMANSAREI